jgi:hypothetical protein
MLDEQYFLAITQSNSYLRVPAAAWNAISIKLKDDNLGGRFGHFDFNFDKLAGIFPTEQWIPIEDKRIVDLANHPAIQRALRAVLGSSRPGNSLWATDSSRLRIIDMDACKRVLAEVQAEEDTQGWLETLISGEKA